MKTYGDYLSTIFPEIKVQKLSVDAGFTCPNRDGSISSGGCSYCRNDSFSPTYCDPLDSIAVQLKKGKDFFARKYPEMKYLAYFQRYTGTHGFPAKRLETFYRAAMEEEDIVGLVIATRPDCLPSSTVSLLSHLNREKPVFMEIGAETSFDSTLKAINRNHTWKDVEEAVVKLTQKGLRCGLHLIAGLPDEDNDMIIKSVEKACNLPIETLKMHQLQILYGTPLYRQWKEGRVKIKEFTVDEYLELCVRIIRTVPQHIIIERFLAQSPPEMVASPKWGLKNYQFITKLATLIEKKTL